MRKSYKAALLYGPRDIRIEPVPLPDLGPHDVLIRNRNVSICPTDQRKYLGMMKLPDKPLILGHEVAGVIEEVGEEVVSFKEDDRIFVMPFAPCGECFYCQTGRGYVNCENPTIIGVGLPILQRSVELLWKHGIGGGFAEYLKTPEQCIMKIPEGVSFEEASVMDPYACVIRALKACKIQDWNTVLVMGAGPVGILHVQVAKAMGARKVIASEPLELRRERAAELGADVVVNPLEEDLKAVVDAQTGGRGVDVTIVSTGGKMQAPLVVQAIELASIKGRVHVFAGTYPPADITVPINAIHYKELTILSTVGNEPDDYLYGLELIKSKKVNLKGIRSPDYPFEKVAEALEHYGSPDAFKFGIRF